MAESARLTPWSDPIITSTVVPMIPAILLWWVAGYRYTSMTLCAAIAASVMYHRVPFRRFTAWAIVDVCLAVLTFLMSVSAIFSRAAVLDELAHMLLVATLLATACGFGSFHAASEAWKNGDEVEYRRNHVPWHLFVGIGQCTASGYVCYVQKYLLGVQ